MRDAIISFPMFGEGFSLNPAYAVNIGNFSIYYYGIIIAIGFLLAVWYTSKNCKRFGLTMDDVYDYVIWAVIAAVVCARLFYCITYTDSSGVHTYLQEPASFLRIRDGGLAIYGGVIGAVLAVLIRAKTRKLSPWPAFDIMGLGLLIGQFVGRWGNFFNREAYGYETDVFCRMGLTLNGSTIYVHPTFLYESLWNFVGFLFLHFHSKKHRRYQGQYFLMYLLWYGLGRAFIEGLRSDSLWLIPDVIRISQLIAAVTFVLALAVLICNAKRIRAGKRPLLGRELDGVGMIDAEVISAEPPVAADEESEVAVETPDDAPSSMQNDFLAPETPEAEEPTDKQEE